MKRPPNLTAVLDSDRREMSKAETEMFITLRLGPQLSPVPADELKTELGKLFQPAFLQDMATQILLGRLEQTGRTYAPDVVAMASFVADRPGFAVLWAYTLFERTRELGRAYTFDDLVHDFPTGFPTNEAAGAIWDAQKCFRMDPPEPGDNWLDKAEAWKEPEAAQ